jgi:hypothetical protein
MGEEKDQSGVMRKIMALMERGNHPNTSQQERESCFEKADAMMGKYRVDAAMLLEASGVKQRRTAIKRTVPFVSEDNEFNALLGQCAAVLAQLASVRIVMVPKFGDYKGRELTVVGMPHDCDYYELLWMNAYMTFSSRLFPKWDRSKTLAWNITRQKEAGIKWGNIYDLAVRNGWSRYRKPGRIYVDVWSYGDDDPSEFGSCRLIQESDGTISPVPIKDTYMMREDNLFNVRVDRCPNDGGYFKRLYELQCVQEGTAATGHTTKNAAYRESYAVSFVREISVRSRDLLYKRQTLERGTPGAQVALRDVRYLVDDLYNELFPPNAVKTGESYKRKYDTDLNGSAIGTRAGQEVALMPDGTHLRKDQTGRELER